MRKVVARRAWPSGLSDDCRGYDSPRVARPWMWLTCWCAAAL